MSSGQKPRQLSLLDLEPPSGGPTQRELVYWETWNKDRFQRLVQDFRQQYLESPIMRRRLLQRNLDLYMTHPKNAYLVHQRTGELVQDQKLLRQAWSMDIDKFSAERRRHLSAQIADLLDGKMSPEDWQPEIAQRITFDEDRQQDLQLLLQDQGLAYSLERDGFRGKIWVFGAPAAVKSFLKRGQEAGILA